MKYASRYYRFAKIALELALLSEDNATMTHRMCAMVIKRNKVLSVGYNSRKTSPVVDTKMKMWHAEHHAVTRCPATLVGGSDLIVVRSRSSGLPGMARPCSACREALRRCGVRRVFYTINSDDPENPALEDMRL